MVAVNTQAVNISLPKEIVQKLEAAAVRSKRFKSAAAVASEIVAEFFDAWNASEEARLDVLQQHYPKEQPHRGSKKAG